MSGTSKTASEFINRAEAIIREHLSDETFGVAELSEALNMSRSNLLRKFRKYTKLSASQFIRQERLKKGMELLRETSLTVSEISYQVGFGSTSYFIKCFREHYGYPPGEASKKDLSDEPARRPISGRNPWKTIGVALPILLALGFLVWKNLPTATPGDLEKSIAVLPFKNESNDATNVYFINGLMESTLNNLQKVENLRVLSRNSTEKYRHSNKAIQEIGEELNVSYFVTGSGQRLGDRVLLNIRLIEAATDRQIWAEQYSRQVGDIFALQNEIARKITDAIKVFVTPAELELIAKRPTESLEAYDYYLQALDGFHANTKEGLETAIPLFEKAIEQDPEFSLAYANIAMAYFFLDIYLAEKQYADRVNIYADKALLYDSKSAESLIAKALYYLETREYRLALPHLEKALEYNPNSSAVVQLLSDYYARIVPNTGKYLEYALKGLQLDIAANDSTTRSYTFLHLSNALVQTGFVEESLEYIDKSLAYDPQNAYAPFLKCYILYARDRDIEKTKKLLTREWEKDTTRLDILQEVGKIHYFLEAYDSAFYYYEKFVRAREGSGLEIYPQEDLKIGVVYQKMGLEQEAGRFFEAYADYCEADQSIYKSASMAGKFAHEGKYEEAIEQLRDFSTQQNYQYWIVLFLEMDPIIKPLKSHPEFDAIVQKIKDRFWENHDRLRNSLEEKGLL